MIPPTLIIFTGLVSLVACSSHTSDGAPSVPATGGTENATVNVAVVAAPSSSIPAGRAVITVRVTPSALTVTGDTVRVSYLVTNDSSSTRTIFNFLVDAPSTGLRVETPQPSTLWYVTQHWQHRPLGNWTFLGDQGRPGRTAGPLVLSAIGLPGVVTWWGIPYLPADSVASADEDERVRPVVSPAPGASSADSGHTVGIVPFPADRSPAALLTRLGHLVDEACVRGWVDDAAACTRLKANLAAGGVAVFVRELDAQRGSHVAPAAYFLLRENARMLAP